jgi:disease resistance protein RPM1
VLEANERRRRYKLDDCIPGDQQGMRSKLHDCGTSTSTSVDPRLPALYNEASSLVGIDNQKEELINMLMDDEREKLRVVSIVGLGGLGKSRPHLRGRSIMKWEDNSIARPLYLFLKHQI